MANVSEILQKATEILQISGIAEPRREANSLLAFVLKKDKSFLFAHPEYELTEEEAANFQDFLNRRAAREPFQYIVGRQEFYKLDFLVTPDVLIPRPETELIVENAIEILRAVKNPRFCEVGIGSGCISVAILHEIKTACAVGLDVSENALRIAGINAERNAVAKRLELKISDVFTNISAERFNLIVSNPPYITSEDFSALQVEVREHEPKIALTDDKDGLSIIEKIVVESPRFLKSGGFLLMEIGFDQSNQVREMFDGQIWRSLEFLEDLQGIARMVKAQLVN